ncbi:MAG: hypothetical protein QM766_15140 [Burkholderiaceae bacterium]
MPSVVNQKFARPCGGSPIGPSPARRLGALAAAALWSVAVLGATAGTANAQGSGQTDTPVQAADAPMRAIPGDARLGRLAIGVFPEATIDGKPVRFTAGARIHDRENRIAMPAGLTEPVDVLYRLDQAGQVTAAWILTTDELAAARRRR